MKVFLIANNKQIDIFKSVLQIKKYQHHELILPDNDFDMFNQEHIVKLMSNQSINRVVVLINYPEDVMSESLIKTYNFYAKLNEKKWYNYSSNLLPIIDETEFDNDFVMNELYKNINQPYFTINLNSYQNYIKNIFDPIYNNTRFNINLNHILSIKNITREQIIEYLETKELISKPIEEIREPINFAQEDNWFVQYLTRYLDYIYNIVTAENKWLK